MPVPRTPCPGPRPAPPALTSGTERHLPRYGPGRPQWYWQANPDPGWLTLAGDGLARLRAVPNDLGNLRTISQILGRQLHGDPSDLTASLRQLMSYAKQDQPRRGP